MLKFMPETVEKDPSTTIGPPAEVETFESFCFVI